MVAFSHGQTPCKTCLCSHCLRQLSWVSCLYKHTFIYIRILAKQFPIPGIIMKSVALTSTCMHYILWWLYMVVILCHDPSKMAPEGIRLFTIYFILIAKFQSSDAGNLRGLKFKKKLSLSCSPHSPRQILLHTTFQHLTSFFPFLKDCAMGKMRMEWTSSEEMELKLKSRQMPETRWPLPKVSLHKVDLSFHSVHPFSTPHCITWTA